MRREDMQDLVSVITPVYNVEKYIEQTIQSMLAQTYENWEMILVEDGSNDATVDKIQGFTDERIKLIILNKNGGAAAARNAGMEKAKGRFVGFLDADDLWREDKLEQELSFMKKKDAAFAFTGYEFGDEQAKGTGKIVKVPETINYRQALSNTTIFTSTVLFDTTKISKEKLYMPIIKSEDTALWWNVLRDGTVAYGLNENLVTYRRPAKSLSSNKVEALRRIWNLYRKFEHLNFFYSAWLFCGWAVRAMRRRV